MTRSSILKLAVAALGGAAVAAALLMVLSLVNAGSGFSRTTAATGLGWLVPLVSGLIAGAVAWMLLAGGRSGERLNPLLPGAGSSCPACGGSVRDGWRLCPHCGGRL